MEEECTRCGRTVARRYRTVDGNFCLSCLLLSGRLVRRSLVIAAVVGTLLIAINQGNRIVDGGGADLYWKIPLTFLVPYFVATLGALLNARE